MMRCLSRLMPVLESIAMALHNARLTTRVPIVQDDLQQAFEHLMQAHSAIARAMRGEAWAADVAKKQN
jgi:hypothetical protein